MTGNAAKDNKTEYRVEIESILDTVRRFTNLVFRLEEAVADHSHRIKDLEALIEKQTQNQKGNIGWRDFKISPKRGSGRDNNETGDARLVNI